MSGRELWASLPLMSEHCQFSSRPETLMVTSVGEIHLAKRLLGGSLLMPPLRTQSQQQGGVGCTILCAQEHGAMGITRETFSQGCPSYGKPTSSQMLTTPGAGGVKGRRWGRRQKAERPHRGTSRVQTPTDMGIPIPTTTHFVEA